MASIFDGLTVSAPGLGAGTTPGPESDAIPQVTVPQMPSEPHPSGLRTLPQSTPTAAAVGSTGLLARVEPQEFVRVVTNAGTGIVLYTPQINSTPQRTSIDRYVASIGGIVFITIAAKVLKFPSTVQVVNAAAVLCDSRPLSNQDKM